MSAVDWSAMSTEDVIASARSAPAVMGPWVDCNTCGNGVRMYREGMWSRHQVLPTSSGGHACVQPATPGPGWLWSIGYEKGDGGLSETAENAMAAADAALTAKGYRLMQTRG